jgi:hypothetical protein
VNGLPISTDRRIRVDARTETVRGIFVGFGRLFYVFSFSRSVYRSAEPRRPRIG